LKKIIQALDTSAIVAMTDHYGKIEYVNPLFCKISKYSAEELIGNTHRIVNSGFHPPSFFKSMWDTILQGKVWKGEIKNKAKDGSTYWVFTSIVPLEIQSTPQKKYKFISIRFDITQQKEAEEKIRKAMESLKEERAKTIYAEKMASLGELSAGIAHELGNPLGALRGRIEMLDQQILNNKFSPEKAHKTLEKVLQLTDKISRIIRGLSAYARDGSQDPYQKTDIIPMIQGILEFSNEKFKKQGIKVETQGIEKNLHIECREAEIGQVFVNLLNNACDAVSSSKDPRIWLELSKTPQDTLKIRVKDNGCGIPPEKKEKIFQSFYTTKKAGKGTGLGLSISRSIVQSHHGQIYLEDHPELTSFVVELPLKQPSPS
ncbi:MAG: PAS domain-containing sensor histidine kinase, partial [Bdellovibrio sp.]